MEAREPVGLRLSGLVSPHTEGNISSVCNTCWLTSYASRKRNFL
jgi:hypothetical protein